MEAIDDTLNLDNYTDLTDYINRIKNSDIDWKNINSFDTANLLLFKKWKDGYEEAERIRNEQIELLRNGDYEIDPEILKNKLLEAGYDEEEIKEILDSLPIVEDTKKHKNRAALIALIAFGASIANADFRDSKDYLSAVMGHAGDQFFNYSDTPAWLLNGPLKKIFLSMGSGELIGGAAAALTIGTVLAFEDGEFNFEKWLEEGFSATVGSVSSYLTLVALGGTAAGAGAIIVSAAAGVAVTYGLSKIIESFYKLPGDVPRDFDSWDENEKKKYLLEQTGINFDWLNTLDELYKSKVIDDIEVQQLFDVCTRDYSNEMGYDTTDDDYIKVAFYIYMSDKSYFDGEEFVGGEYLCSKAATFGAYDYAKLQEYVERFRDALRYK